MPWLSPRVVRLLRGEKKGENMKAFWCLCNHIQFVCCQCLIMLKRNHESLTDKLTFNQNMTRANSKDLFARFGPEH